jgi:hypothetical protein
MSDGVVFVLGAGFTRAFVPKAPLLVDDYGILDLRKRFESFPHAAAILDDALAEYPDGRVDIERLMTRLSGMPYDAVDVRHELALLETFLRKSLVQRIKDAKTAGVESGKLGAFARLVRKDKASIVTFNYDDVLDEALWKVAQTPIANLPSDPHAWHPDGGYGFYCRPSSVCVADDPMYMNETDTLLLKLHGSTNWYSRLGEGTSRGPAGILHHEDWYKMPVPSHFHQPAYERIESHLEPDPFIVPPVLAKAELAVHPVLSVIWKLAHKRLETAKTVVFIGYSLPVTDLASRILFRETLANRADLDVQVVSIARDGDEEQAVKLAYRSLFKGLPDTQFDFSGARAWIERQLG